MKSTIRYIFLATSFLSCVNSSSNKQKTVTTVNKQSIDTISIANPHWINSGSPLFNYDDVNDNFKLTNLTNFIVNDDTVKLVRLDRSNYYYCFQNITLGVDIFCNTPFDCPVQPKYLDTNNSYYYYSEQLKFQSYDNFSHTFTTYKVIDEVDTLIVGLFHRYKNLSQSGSSDYDGHVSSLNSDYFILAQKRKESDTIIETSTRLLRDNYLLQTTTKKTANYIDSTIAVIKHYTWDVSLYADEQKFVNNKLVERFQNIELREQLNY